MNYYEEIKTTLVNNEIIKKVKDYSKNKSDLNTYYHVGQILSEAGKHYGEGIIKQYANNLTNEVDKKYNETTLKRIRQFYRIIEKGATLWHQLSWSHYRILIVLDSIDQINYYGKMAVINKYSVRQLEKIIKNKEYERLPVETKNKLIDEEQYKIENLIKNPIIIKNNNYYEELSEKILQKLILEDIEHFMKELGNSFAFIGSEYKIKLGDRYNYIDLLLFNYEYNCFVVIELKITELKKEHIGQIQLYMNYVDCHLKKQQQNTTIGIIICKKNNQYVIEYCSDERIITREYLLL